MTQQARAQICGALAHIRAEAQDDPSPEPLCDNV
jgi:hypothetical protein